MLADSWKIGLGLLVFLGGAASLWVRAPAGAPVVRPAEGACLDPRIREVHPTLLARWREEAVRGDLPREEGQSLEQGCLGCHTDPAVFCDRCHAASNVQIDCWDCHQPGERR